MGTGPNFSHLAIVSFKGSLNSILLNLLGQTNAREPQNERARNCNQSYQSGCMPSDYGSAPPMAIAIDKSV